MKTSSFAVIIAANIETLVREGGYYFPESPLGLGHHSNLTSSNFPREKKGKRSVTMFHFDRAMTSGEAITEMRQSGYRPGTAHELLALSNIHRELRDEFSMVALGSVHTERCSGYKYVAVINLHKAGLPGIYRSDVIWGKNCHFIGVRSKK
ncbi:MAG: hypothetical protein UT50_C0032G0002 [Candidatus Moranbacteria bacterium GW2011_GWA2_39_41]|nr:MAG: hypothetical protein UT50_C0032G0002 [Candidatus Moranbacteria bacterium GW2011_GWA2_39_41]